MDIFDKAQETDAQFRAMSIDAVKRLAAQKRYASAFECGWCGEDIPEQRRLAVPGCELCAPCQSQKEHLKDSRQSLLMSDREQRR